MAAKGARRFARPSEIRDPAVDMPLGRQIALVALLTAALAAGWMWYSQRDAADGPRETATVRILNSGFRHLKKNTRCLPLEIGGLDKLAKRLDTLRINMLVVRPELSTQALEFAEHAEEAATESGFADLLLKQKNGWFPPSSLF